MRRLCLSLLAFAAVLFVAAPARASIPPHPNDYREWRTTSSSTFQAEWRLGTQNIKPCELDFVNRRPEGHSVRIEVVLRSPYTLVFSQAYFVASGTQTSILPNLPWYPLSREEYARFKWDDDTPPYTYGTLDLFHLTNPTEQHPYGYWIVC